MSCVTGNGLNTTKTEKCATSAALKDEVSSSRDWPRINSDFIVVCHLETKYYRCFVSLNQ